MKSLIIVLAALLCLIVSPTTTIGGWPKPSDVSNEELLMTSGQPNFYGDKFNFGDSKIWKCTYNNGSGAAVSISYPSPPQPPSRKPPTPSLPQTPKKYPPPPKPLPPRPTPKKSPPPPKPTLPPPKPLPPGPTPKKSPPPSKPSLPPPKSSPPRPTPKKSPPPPPKPSHPLPKISPPIGHSPPNESTLSLSPPAESAREPTTPSTPRHHSQNPNSWGHFISCMSDFGPSAICKQQMEVSYYTGRFRVSDNCCNLIVNMRNECTDVILGFYTDPFFVPLIRCTCHVKN